MAAYETVPEGRYWGLTYAQLLAEKAKYVEAVIKAGATGDISGLSENGKSISLVTGAGGRTLLDWGVDIRMALPYVSDDPADFLHLPTKVATASFNCFR